MCSVSKWLAILCNLWWITMWGMCMVAHSASLLFFNWPWLLDFTRQLHFISISLIRISIVNHIRYRLIRPENFRRKNVHLKVNHVNLNHSFLNNIARFGFMLFSLKHSVRYDWSIIEQADDIGVREKRIHYLTTNHLWSGSRINLQEWCAFALIVQVDLPSVPMISSQI